MTTEKVTMSTNTESHRHQDAARPVTAANPGDTNRSNPNDAAARSRNLTAWLRSQASDS